MRRYWLDIPERGTTFMMQLILWIACHIGRPTARALLYPITLYFFLSASEARKASRLYLRRVFGKPPSLIQMGKHFFTFSTSLLDRIYFMRGEYDRFDIRMFNDPPVREQLKAKQGCILMGSHLGSFDALRTLAVGYEHIPLKIVMNRRHNEVVTKILESMNPDIGATVIEPGTPDTLLNLKEYLDQGYFIGILGDRTTPQEKHLKCNFLGDYADFPAGPIILAGIFKVPVFLFFGLYRGGNRYDIHFELLVDGARLDRNKRQTELQYWTQHYADRLAYYTRLAPYNWFNFFDFWNEESDEQKP